MNASSSLPDPEGPRHALALVILQVAWPDPQIEAVGRSDDRAQHAVDVDADAAELELLDHIRCVCKVKSSSAVTLAVKPGEPDSHEYEISTDDCSRHSGKPAGGKKNHRD